MKSVRRLLIGLGVFTLLLAVATAVAFSTRFQTWAARKAIASQPGLSGTVELVSAGLKRVEIKNARIERNGVVLTLPAAEVELPLVAAGMNRKVFVSRLVAKGWTLDLTDARPPVRKPPIKTVSLRGFSLASSAIAAASTTAVVEEIFRGIFPSLQLPVDLSLDGVELEGEIVLPPMRGQPAARVKVSLAGGGLAAGREGRFVYDLSANSSAGVAPISAHALHGSLTATMDTPRTFVRVGAKAEASVSGTQFPRGVKLNLEAGAARETAGENYSLMLLDGEKQIVLAQAELPLAGGVSTPVPKLKGTWKLNLRDGDLAPFLLGVVLPVFEVVGDGDFETDVVFAEARSSGKINATASQLGNHRAELAPLGAVQLAADFGVARRGDALLIEHLSADLHGIAPVASVRALQRFEFNPVTRELTANPAQDLFGISLQGLPLAWVQALLPRFKLRGGDLQGEFVASAGKDGLVLHSKRPLEVAQLSLSMGEKPILAAVDFSLMVSADYTPQGWQAVISPLTAKSGTAVLFTLEAKAGQLAGQDRSVKATGTMTVNLPAALAQPGIGQTWWRSGTAALDFSTSLGGKQEIQAKLALRDLAVDPELSPAKLPTITTELRADRETGGKISFSLPVLVERDGRKSDLSVTGFVAPDKTGYIFDGHLTSDQLVLDDVKILGVPFATEPRASAPPETNPPRDTAPPWAGITGQLTLALKKVIYSETFAASDVAGTLRIDAGSVKLEGLRAGVGDGGEAKMSGGLQFNANVMEPYSLQGRFALENFDSTPLFRALDPGRAVTVEGRFNLVSQVNGTGANLTMLASQTRGDVQMISKRGIFRGLQSDTAEAIKAAPSTLAGIVTGLGSLLGKDAGEKADKLGGDINKRGRLIADIATAFAEIPYDQLSVSLVRNTSLNFELKDFSLISPEVRLVGTGVLTHEDQVPLLGQRLELKLQIGVRDKLADLVKRASLLGNAHDTLGYTAFAFPVQIGGTLSSPDVSELKRELFKAATGGSLLNLMRR